ncbi:MAG: sulfotransferase [Phycisphaerales bacterium]|nr:sulfotransferase [Phycisphaerales bacterium]
MYSPTPREQEAARLMRTGGAAQAEALCRAEIAQRPGAAGAHALLAELAASRGDLAAAEKSMRDAASHAPRHAPFLFNHGTILAGLGRTDEAIERLRAAINLNPGFFQYHASLGWTLEQAGRGPEALVAFRRAIDTLPADPRACQALGEQLRDRGHPELALPCFERWCIVDPRDPQAPWFVGGAHFRMREWAKAAEAYRRSIARDGRFVHAHALLAETLERVGDDAEAEAAARRALALDPAHPTACLALARVLRKRKEFSEARGHLDRALANPQVRPRNRASLELELGHVLDGAGDHAEAFEHFVKGQKLCAEQPNAARVPMAAYPGILEQYRLLVEAADPQMWTRRRPPAREAPIFFVGFPRSGTTLTEQILGAHPRLAPSDEPPFTARLIEDLARTHPAGYPACIPGLSDAELDALAARYWAEADALLGDGLRGRRLVDKLPLNICHLPLLARVFPGAKVLVALRDPRDCCLSAFMQEFQPNAAMIHFFRLDTTAALYAGVMRNWLLFRDRLGLDFMETRYEDLVDDVEATARRIIDFLGEPWDDAVLRWQSDHKRLIKTPSYQAVAQPVTRRAVARWRRYEAQMRPVLPTLEPFVSAFGYEPSPA